MLNRFLKVSESLILGLLVFAASTRPIFAQNSQSQNDEASSYTLMPIFLPEGPAFLTYENLLTAMVKDQGYEAHCAGTEWVINKKLWGDVEKFFSNTTPPAESFYNGFNPIVFSGTDPYLVDFSKARIPMMRGLEPKSETLKNSSLEGMFGANYQIGEDSYLLNSAGVSEKLLSSYQQCLAKTQNLVAALQICDEVTDEKCTLNKEYSFKTGLDTKGNRRVVMDYELVNPKQHGLAADPKVEETIFDFKILNNWLKAIRPELNGAELYQQVCSDITGGTPDAEDNGGNNNSDNPPSISAGELSRDRTAINLISIDLDSLYRTAYLVLVPTQDEGKSGSDNFYFLQSSPQIDAPVGAPIFIAFKIPEFGTNKSRTINNIDSLELTKMIIQSQEQNDKDTADQDAKRSEVYDLAKSANFGASPVVNCPPSYPQCARSPQNALLNVIVDTINAAAPNCSNSNLRVTEETSIEDIFNQEDLNWEKAGELFTPASKDIKENAYRSSINKALADQLKSNNSNLFEWKLTIDQNPPQLDPPVIVNAYLVLPVGETIKDANKSLGAFWNEDSFFEEIQNNVIEDMKNKQGAIPKYYTIKSAIVGIGSSDSVSLKDACRNENVAKQDSSGHWYTEIVQVCSNYSFGVKLDEAKKTNPDEAKEELLFPDFGLGFMIRKIQQKLRNTYSQTYNYILSCTRVEDMFLGRCSGDPKANGTQTSCSGEGFKKIKNIPSADSIPQFSKDIFTAEIAPRITPELIEAYEYAEKETGIPCEVVAGIHWTEGGSNANQSVFDGGTLRGTLKEDAKAAMEHLISKWPSQFDKENIDYQTLVTAIGYYNGQGNWNCSHETRWSSGGKCPPEFISEDHPHPLAWIDDRHNDMDLIYCLDYVEFNCSEEPTAAAMTELSSHLDQKQEEIGFSDETKQSLITQAQQYCYANSSICQTLSEGRKYPKYERPGTLATAILLNGSGAAQ